jgi:hypothetical protein
MQEKGFEKEGEELMRGRKNGEEASDEPPGTAP